MGDTSVADPCRVRRPRLRLRLEHPVVGTARPPSYETHIDTDSGEVVEQWTVRPSASTGEVGDLERDVARQAWCASISSDRPSTILDPPAPTPHLGVSVWESHHMCGEAGPPNMA